jgi:hypothetical protein
MGEVVNVRFVAIGNWGESDVIVSRVSDSRVRDPATEKLIDAAWEEGRARNGVKLFDGPMCRLERVSAGAKLELDLSVTSYKIFWGTNLNHPQVPARARANGIGMSCALENVDGALVLGRRTSSVAYYLNRVHPFAGTLEPAEKIDIFADMRRELREELSLEAREIGSMMCQGIIEDAAIHQPELIFTARCGLSRAEIERRLDAGEHERCVWVEPTERAAEAALDDGSLTPVAVGTVLLWGRGRFGQAWFGAWFDAATRARNLRG